MKKFISYVLTAVMLFTILPFSALAIGAEMKLIFTIDGIETPVEDGKTVVCYSLESWASCAPDHAINAQLIPDENGGYVVAAVSSNPIEDVYIGLATDIIEASGFIPRNGDIYIISRCKTDDVKAEDISVGMRVEFSDMAVGATITMTGEDHDSPVLQISNENNLALGKSYTHSKLYRQGTADVNWGYYESAPISYPDENGYSLTDGFVPDDAEYKNRAWAGFHARTPDIDVSNGGDGYAWIAVDLEEVCHLDQCVVFVPSTGGDTAAGIFPPHAVRFSGSVDGENWETIGELNEYEILMQDKNFSEYVIAATVNSDISARYIRAEVSLDGWIFISEVAVYGTVYSHATDDETEPTPVPDDADLKFNISVPETYIPGETVYVDITVDDIIPENGLHAVESYLYFDEDKLEPILLAEGSSAVNSFFDFAEWEDLTFLNLLEDGTAVINLRAATAGTAEGNFTSATEDGQLKFTVPFKVKNDAAGDLMFRISDSSVLGTWIDNQNGNIFDYNGKGSYAFSECDRAYIGTEGLVYTLNSDGSSYSVTGYTGTDVNVLIPSYYNALPVTAIGDYAFSRNSSILSVTVSENVTTIGSHAFAWCFMLGEIKLPDSLVNIYGGAFRNSAMTKIHIPENVRYIDTYIFSGCGMLKEITVSENNSTFHGDGNCIINTSEKKLVVGCRESVIPADGSVTSIADYVFVNSFVGKIYISEHIVEITSNSFSTCYDISSITVDKNNPVFHSKNNCLIKTDSKILVLGCKNSIIPDDGSVTEIGINAFDGAMNLNRILIPRGVVSIGHHAFYGTGVTSVTLPDTLETINCYAFGGCDKLTSITIPASVKNTEDNIFYLSENLKNIYCGATSKPSGWHNEWNGYCNAEVHWAEPQETESQIVLGDINDNDKIDMTDYILLKRAYFGTFKFNDEQNKAGDINKNNKIDMTDYILLKRVYFGTFTIK